MKRLVRLAVLGGALLVGFLVLRAGPKDVLLVYDLAGAPGATRLEVELRRAGETMRRAEFRFASGAPGQVRHEAKLPDGDYTLRFQVDAAAGPFRGERPLRVAEDGTIVLSLVP